MSKKQYHYIYKITNLINNKFYVGMHSTFNLEDGYLGSGVYLHKSIKKYGKENFKKEILEYLFDRKTLKNREKEIVNKEFLNNPLCMNLQIGGQGEFSKNACIKGGKIGGKKTQQILKYLRKNDKEWVKRNHNILSILHKGQQHFLGKHHTNESKTKMKLTFKNINHQKGEKNSQYGTCWINNGIKCKKIKKENLNLFINLNWVKGRKLYECNKN